MTAQAPIRVLLVEDSDVYRDSLVFLLDRRGDIDVVAAVADGSSAVGSVGELRPDVVVLDYRLPDLEAGEVAAQIRERAPETVVVLLSASAGRDELDLAAFANAPLVRKDQGVDALVDAVRAAVRGSNE